jgi:hypothetical protein
MPTTGTINTQQILQMGTVAEKLQQTIQHLPSATSQQIQDDQKSMNELKQTEVQEPKKIEFSDPINPEGKRRRQLRIRNKSKQSNNVETPQKNTSQEGLFSDICHQGQKINLTV